MVPARFVGLDSLPVTVNGKLDQSALPQPAPDNLLPGQAAHASAASSGAGSDGAVHDQVAGIVCELLGLPAVDADDNIFVVGGHSMLAMQLVARVKQVFGVRLTLRQVFDKPTVSGIAATVVERTAGST